MQHQFSDSLSYNVKVNQVIIEERERDMNEIVKDIETINEIYKDLSLLVSEQGDNINIIADNIEHTVESTKCAVQELEKAEKRQTRTCIIL